MPTFAPGPVLEYVLWNLGVFVLSFIPNSFMEWITHRFILHSKAIVKFAYEEHDQEHHKEYLADSSFAVPGKDYGIDFGLRDWLMFIVVIMPAWAGIEYWTGKPLLIGAALSTCLWLQMFNVIHRHFHAPTGSWIERTWYYRVLHRHHRQHHRDTKTNFNVCFFPVADFFLGTLRVSK